MMKHVDSSDLPWTMTSFFKHFTVRGFPHLLFWMKTGMNDLPPHHAEVPKKSTRGAANATGKAVHLTLTQFYYGRSL